MEEIKWLDVVLDYGKRFPNREVNELLPESMNECKFSKLIVYKSGTYSKYIHLSNKYNYYVFSTTLNDGKGELEYFHAKIFCWIKVSGVVLSRLLTEGKEDLI